jgi:histidine triad (HIT) family protein
MECIFCKIVKNEIPALKVFESDEVIAFKDIEPKARVHILVIPKKHIESVKYLEESDKCFMGELILVAQKIAKDNELQGYKLVINVGREGGQIVNHLHLHLLSGDANDANV